MKDFKSSNSMSMESAANRRTPSGRAAFIPGAALLILMLSFGIAGCSKSKPNGGFGQNSASQNASVQNTAIPTPTSMAVTVDQPELTKKKSVRGPVRKIARTLSYSDETSGLSFAYPRKSTLREGEKIEQDSASARQLPMNFVQPGGERLVMLELPTAVDGKSTSSLFFVSVNKRLNAEQCGQFTSNPVLDRDPADQAKQEPVVTTGSKVFLGGVEYLEIEKDSEQNMAKYYHRFVPGSSSPDSESAENSCYEFSLRVQNAGQERETELKDVFASLNKVLASVKIKPEEKNEIVDTGKAEKTTNPVASETVQTAKTDVKSEVSPH
jgi:hypothetical protein